MRNVAHKIRLIPNNKQKTLFAKACGTARFSYNWALAEWKKQYEAGGKPSESKLRKELNSIKREQFPWMYEVTKCAPQQAIKNLGTAFGRFFRGESKYPQFKKKGIHDSFYIDNVNLKIKDNRVFLVTIGWVRLAEKFRFKDAKLMSATISRSADQWFVSINCEVPDAEPLPKTGSNVGIDVGTRQYADSKGKFKEVPRAYRKAEKKLKRLSQSLARKQKGSKNRQKAKDKLARCHLRVANIRQDWLHEYTTNIVRQNDIIGIEDLNVKGMVKNHYLAKSIQDAAFGEFSRQIKYKSQWYGRKVVIADRWFASSKICSKCGVKAKQRMTLDVREWACEHCGATHHRDTNSAVNLEKHAVSSTASACGEFYASAEITRSSPSKQPRRSRKKSELLGLPRRS